MVTKGNDVRRSSTYSKNVYSYSSGEIHTQRLFNKRAISNSPFHSINDTGNGLEISLDKDATDFEDVILRSGTTIPPDEILGSANPGRIKIPIKHRNEFPKDKQLPSSDLLQILHYFTSKKLTKSDSPSMSIRKMDETSLLALGIMIESWIDDMVDEDTAKMFLQFNKDAKTNSSLQSFLSSMSSPNRSDGSSIESATDDEEESSEDTSD
ncbi:hypothetical protein DFJ63DRAFT_315940 [Scheffersomyces coipomensis]|uniref:uncharacterized protein n=1 Tax=Scheffersomyces coipomensis TaxID=1788519 RepID=UPI00315D4A71